MECNRDIKKVAFVIDGAKLEVSLVEALRFLCRYVNIKPEESDNYRCVASDLIDSNR